MAYSTNLNKKGHRRIWHTAKCINYAITLGICNPICVKLLQLMSGVITINSVEKDKVSILING